MGDWAVLIVTGLLAFWLATLGVVTLAGPH
jgi:hypothetical protein